MTTDTAHAHSQECELMEERRLKVLSLCCLYPNSLDSRQGIFVQRRLQHLAETADVKVVAPFAIVQYGNPKGRRVRTGRQGCTREMQVGTVTVLYPRWFYPPFSGSMTPFWLSLRIFWTLRRVRQEFSFDILDTHFGFPEGIAGAVISWALGVPFTMTLRGNEPKHSQTRLGRACMSWALRRAIRVFAVSERLRQFAIGLGASPEAARTIPNGVESEIFRPRDLLSCRRRLGLPVNRRIILSAGALVERKGHHRIMQALRALLDEGADAHLAIAGGPGPEGAYESELRSLSERLQLTDRVSFLGPLEPACLSEAMSAADVFCLASTNEGWPNVVHEALACGAPVVATDVGAVPEMLAGGRFGSVVPVNDPAALKCALRDALNRTWDRASIADWGAARGWSQVASEVLEEMRAALKTASG